MRHRTEAAPESAYLDLRQTHIERITFGRTVLPLGRPFGFIRKGPLSHPVKVLHVIEPVAVVAKG